MATFYLINSLRYGANFLWAGTQFDDTVDDTTGIAAAGGLLVASATTGMATASAEALAIKLRGGVPEDAAAIMKAAYDAYQTSFETAHDTVNSHVTGLTVNNAVTGATVDSHGTGLTVDNYSVPRQILYAKSLPAAAVSMHAQDAGGGPLALVAGWTNPLPRRGMNIARSAAGPANVTYTITWQLPDGTTTTEDVIVASGGNADSTLAGAVVSVTTTVDPVSTSDFVTTDAFSLGEVFSGTPALAVNGVSEALVGSDAASGTIIPTTSPDGAKEFVIQFISVHQHAVTDAGHVHAVTDAGHVHAVTDAGHTHALS